MYEGRREVSEHPEYIRGVKDCIEALPVKLYSIVGVAKVPVSTRECRDALEALLPKPDHAKAAVEAFRKWRDRAVADGVRVIFDEDEALARWLEHQGVDLSRWGE